MLLFGDLDEASYDSRTLTQQILQISMCGIRNRNPLWRILDHQEF